MLPSNPALQTRTTNASANGQHLSLFCNLNLPTVKKDQSNDEADVSYDNFNPNQDRFLALLSYNSVICISNHDLKFIKWIRICTRVQGAWIENASNRRQIIIRKIPRVYGNQGRNYILPYLKLSAL